VREDIIRGVRAGSILLALFIIGYAGYRLLYEDPGVPATPAEAVSDPGPLQEGTPRAATRGSGLTAVPRGSGVVPPPPARFRSQPAKPNAVQPAPPLRMAVENVSQ
jgi:hypothetical protein